MCGKDKVERYLDSTFKMSFFFNLTTWSFNKVFIIDVTRIHFSSLIIQLSICLNDLQSKNNYSIREKEKRENVV